MRMMVDLPDDLYVLLKEEAHRQGCSIECLIEDLVRRELTVDPGIRSGRPLPIISGGSPARPCEETTPEKVDQILLDMEVKAFLKTADPIRRER